MLRLQLDDKQIRYFHVNNKGKIIHNGDSHKHDWDDTYVDLKKLKVGDNITVSFNKAVMERYKRKAVWTQLNARLINITEV